MPSAIKVQSHACKTEENLLRNKTNQRREEEILKANREEDGRGRRPQFQTASFTPFSDRRAQTKRPKANAAVIEGLEQINLHSAGIDVGSAQNFVCVPAQAVKPGQANVRSFGAFTKDQDDLVEWLKECGILTVAMEATGIYWMSLYDKLEAAHIKVVLVDPHSVKHVPGRKSDVLDCQWPGSELEVRRSRFYPSPPHPVTPSSIHPLTPSSAGRLGTAWDVPGDGSSVQNPSVNQAPGRQDGFFTP